MHERNEKINKVVISLSNDGNRIDRIDIEPRAFRFVDSIIGLMARCFRVAHWGSLRHLCFYQGKPVVRDARLEGGQL